MMGRPMIGEAAPDHSKGDSEIIEQLKEKFHSASEKIVKVQVLTALRITKELVN